MTHVSQQRQLLSGPSDGLIGVKAYSAILVPPDQADRQAPLQLPALHLVANAAVDASPEDTSRLARNTDLYRLLYLRGITDTPIEKGDGLYHPSAFDDRLVLGLKGTRSARH